MNTSTKTLLTIASSLALSIAFLIGVGIEKGLNSSYVPKPTGDVNQIIYPTAANNASSSCSTASSIILSTSTSRNFLQITNTGSTTVYITEGQTAVSGIGIPLIASSSYRTDNANIFTGAFYCISPSAVTNMSILEQK